MTLQEMLFVLRSKLNDLGVKVFSEAELIAAINAGLYDYVSKIPSDAVPELVKVTTFSGSTWSIASDFTKILHVVVSHGVTPSGSTTSTTIVEQCKILDVDEEYYALYAPGWAGAWAKFSSGAGGHQIKAGPNCYSGTVTYIGIPSAITSATASFPLGQEHEDPVMNFAAGMSLAKVNYQASQGYLERYDMRIAAENGVKYPRRKKVEKADPQEGA